MGWFKKKEDDDSDLPELPELPEIDSVMPKNERKEKSYLPSFPPSSVQKMSEGIVKSAVDTTSFQPAIKPPRADVDIKRSIEMPKKSFEPKLIKSSPFSSKEMKEPSLPASLKKNEPIFVRIDKFETALEGIRNIKKKVDEMESLLTNLRQVNAKEDLELSEWEREINAIKTKIESIDANLFSKLG